MCTATSFIVGHLFLCLLTEDHLGDVCTIDVAFCSPWQMYFQLHNNWLNSSFGINSPIETETLKHWWEHKNYIIEMWDYDLRYYFNGYVASVRHTSSMSIVYFGMKSIKAGVFFSPKWSSTSLHYNATRWVTFKLNFMLFVKQLFTRK